MRISALLAASAAALALAGNAAIETVADDYDRGPAPPPKPEKPKATPEESLRVRMARLDRERKDRKRADDMRRAAENANPLHRRPHAE